jgi:hypothetical protein
VLHCFQKKTKRTAKSDKAFKSVWDAIEDDPAQAANMGQGSAGEFACAAADGSKQRSLEVCGEA